MFLVCEDPNSLEEYRKQARLWAKFIFLMRLPKKANNGDFSNLAYNEINNLQASKSQIQGFIDSFYRYLYFWQTRFALGYQMYYCFIEKDFQMKK